MANAHNNPRLSILICTYADRVMAVPSMLLPQRSDVEYVVSMQCGEQDWSDRIPEQLRTRPDITLSLIPGHGLSANRNNAISQAKGDILLIADDDNRYTEEYIDRILNAWQANPQADIITFMAQTHGGELLHAYPAPYVCSVEISMRRKSIEVVGLQFDTRFGLGSPILCAGEEDVFMADARFRGLHILFVPQVVVRTAAQTTSDQFIGNARLQITKGATFRYIYGTGESIWRSIKEAGWYLVHRKANPFPILYNMLKGIWILR